MANIELKDEALDAVSGGASSGTNSNRITMGSTFVQGGHTWYCVKGGDTLGAIARTFGLTVAQIEAYNAGTIKNPSLISAGDLIIIR